MCFAEPRRLLLLLWWWWLNSYIVNRVSTSVLSLLFTDRLVSLLLRLDSLSGSDSVSTADASALTASGRCVVETAHPYTPASVQTWDVEFPEATQWISLAFDRRCATAQQGDCLQVFADAARRRKLLSFSGGPAQGEWPRVPMMVHGNKCFIVFQVRASPSVAAGHWSSK